jgi:hypothetical protein
MTTQGGKCEWCQKAVALLFEVPKDDHNLPAFESLPGR